MDDVGVIRGWRGREVFIEQSLQELEWGVFQAVSVWWSGLCRILVQENCWWLRRLFVVGLFVVVVEVSGQESRVFLYRCEGFWGFSCVCKVWWSDIYLCFFGRFWRACRVVVGVGFCGGLYFIFAGVIGGDVGLDLRGCGGFWRLVMLVTFSSLGFCRESFCRVGDGGWVEEYGRVMGVLFGWLVVVYFQ